MRNRFNGFTTAALALGVLLFGSTQSAYAVPTLAFSVDGAAFTVCADQAACDANATVGAVTFIGGLPGGFTVNVTTGITKPVLPGAEMDLNSVNIQTTGGAHNLRLAFSENDFTATGTGFTGAFGGTQNFSGGSTVEAAAYFDTGNNLFGPTGTPPPAVPNFGTLIGTTGPLVANPFGGTFGGAGPATGPYSLTQLITLNTNGAGSFSGDFELNEVPEPMSVALLGGVLLLTGTAIRRRAKQV